jgi:hypothetical protein
MGSRQNRRQEECAVFRYLHLNECSGGCILSPYFDIQCHDLLLQGDHNHVDARVKEGGNRVTKNMDEIMLRSVWEGGRWTSLPGSIVIHRVESVAHLPRI